MSGWPIAPVVPLLPTAPVGDHHHHHHPHPHGKDEGTVPIGRMGMAEWSEENTLLEFGYHSLEDYLKNNRLRPKVWEDVLEFGWESGRLVLGEKSGL